jgi:hypothetical protein
LVRGRLVGHNRQPAAATEPCRARVCVPRTRCGSALAWLALRTCREASNNSIVDFYPFGYVDGNRNWGLLVDGLRVLCAPHPRVAAAAAVASGSGSLHSDLRNNKLKEFNVEGFLAEALQLQTLYAAANACALRAHRMIGSMARRLAGGNALSCGAGTNNCGWGDETLTIRSPATEMYASVAAGAAASQG